MVKLLERGCKRSTLKKRNKTENNKKNSAENREKYDKRKRQTYRQVGRHAEQIRIGI